MSFQCSHCSFFSKKKFNLERHVKAKHETAKIMHCCDHCGKEYKTRGHYEHHMKMCMMPAGNVAEPAQKVPKTAQKVPLAAQKVPLPAQKVPPTAQKVPDKECTKCGKLFTRNRNLILHMSNCEGAVTEALQCKKCLCYFNSKAAKSRHVKECNGLVSSVSAVTRADDTPITTTNHNTMNIQNQTNNVNTTTNNIEKVENHVTNIIVFDPEGSLLNDRLDRKTMKRIFPRNNDNLRPQLCNYAAELLKLRENQYVRKPHMTNSYSHVHTEDGWKMLPDNHIFPSISRDIANSANDRLYEHPTIGNPTVREKLCDIVSNVEENCKDLKELSMYLKTLANQIDRELRQQEGMQEFLTASGDEVV